MKRIISVFLLMGALVFATGCQKENVIVANEKQIENQFKAEDDEMHAMPPTVQGQILLRIGQSPLDVLITFEGVNVTYYSSTHPDSYGNYSFDNVVVGHYKQKTYQNGILSQSVDYVVE